MQLRQYQTDAVNALWQYWRENATGHPLIVAPTGSGKSLIIAEICRRINKVRPQYKILILCHRKEILRQNAEKVSALTGLACGIYSASLGVKRFRTITCGQIQSLYKKTLEEMQLIIIDECHLLSNDSNSMYRKLLAKQPSAKIVGLTATPYRMDQGSLLSDGSIFSDIAYDIAIPYLISDGFLSPVISRPAEVAIDTTGVRITNGDFNQSQLAEKVLTLEDNHAQEIKIAAGQRNHWLVFCVGIAHSVSVCNALARIGITAEYVTGEMLPMQRDQIIQRFARGEIQALCNCDVLTTGFDFPGIDLIAIIRPTKSVGLYVQIVGRGMRPAEGKENCLLLDFGGNIERHGPIDCIEVKKKDKKDKNVKIEIGVMPTKTCPKCNAVLSTAYRMCPYCGEMLAELTIVPEKVAEVLSKNEIWPVTNVDYKIHNKEGKPPSLRICYYSGRKQVSEFLCFEHGGYAESLARRKWRTLTGETKPPESTQAAFNNTSLILIPAEIEVIRDGKFYKLLKILSIKEDIDPTEEIGINI